MNKLKLGALYMIALVYAWGSMAQEQPAQLVSVDKAKIEKIQPGIWLPANVVSRNEAPISTELTGQLLFVVDIGSEVRKGQIIATVDKQQLLLQLERQQAKVNQQKAQVQFLEKQKKRLSSLKQTNNASVAELERVVLDLTVAQNEVIALSAEISQTQLSITKADIVAPYSGTISERMVGVGEFVTAGRPIVKLVDTEHLDILIAAPIALAPFIKDQQNVMVKWQDSLIELPIRRWSKAGEQTSRTFNVLLNADGISLLAGSAVSVSLPKGEQDEAILIPRDALFLRENETFVLTVENELAHKIPVSVGQGQDDWIAVRGDLEAGDDVIVRGGERIRAGQKVRIAEPLIAKN